MNKIESKVFSKIVQGEVVFFKWREPDLRKKRCIRGGMSMLVVQVLGIGNKVAVWRILRSRDSRRMVNESGEGRQL